ncbi:endo-1,4-beta-xylanase [Bacteroidia bacterium]|nr:endo-1,4-beta-xylanase [Bacteroidia bacterium]
MDLNYRFQFTDPAYREAADPVCEYFQGKYYLFASHSGGYWSSPDLAHWTFIPCTTIAEIEAYAPSILVRDGMLYYIAGGTKIYCTAHPDKDEWKQIPTKFNLNAFDPAFFQDDNGKVYLYWGCSNVGPIQGVEVNPRDGFAPVGKPKDLILHNENKYGWEVPGNNNNLAAAAWNEGAAMLKYKGKYYLQYASPGTEFRIYGDGIYVGNNPLGPFTYAENSPFSFKPGGFIGGAGHGHTFQDKYGNYWHVASMRISVRHPFERRLGLFPVYLTDDDQFVAHTAWTDYPFSIPDAKVDFKADNRSMNWKLLSYNKPTYASSEYAAYSTANATDEQVETWWAAQTGNVGEWWQVDLGNRLTVRAIQVNFADKDFTTKGTDSYTVYQYKIEASDNGNDWATLVDKTKNTADKAHELLVLDTPAKHRYLRITNTKGLTGKFSLSGFRVFGESEGSVPNKITGLKVEHNQADKRRYRITWAPQDNTTGYIVRWGTKPDQLNSAWMVFTNHLEAGCFNTTSKYYFAVDAFNENGVTK